MGERRFRRLIPLFNPRGGHWEECQYGNGSGFGSEADQASEAASKLPRLGTAIRVGTSQTDDERFSQFVFRQDLYRGRIVRDDTDLHYFLYWKTKDDPEKTAKFEDVRDQVVKLWREEQAIPKAKAGIRRERPSR